MSSIKENEKNNIIDIKKHINNVKLKHPNHLPIKFEVSSDSKFNDKFEKLNKIFLIADTFKFYDLNVILRKFLNLKPEESLFIYIKNTNIIPNQTNFVKEIYEKYKDENNLLVLCYDKENFFG